MKTKKILVEIKFKSFFSCFFFQGDFDKAVSILKPLRYKVDLIGGSRAQVRFKKHFYRVRKSDLRSLT